MQPEPWEPVVHAAQLFTAARRTLEAAVAAADGLGITIPASFPDALDHLQEWTAAADAEWRERLAAGWPAGTPQAWRRPGPGHACFTPSRRRRATP